MIELILTIIATILDDCEDELNHPDDDDGLLEGEPEHRGKAGTVPAHDVKESNMLIYKSEN